MMRTNHQNFILPCFMASVLLLGMEASCFAASKDDGSRSPLGCRDVGYKFDLNVLQILPRSVGDDQSLYFMYNKTDRAINLYQMRQSESSQSVYLNHVIRPHRWAVLSSSERMKYICTMDDRKTSHGKIVDCAESVKVCEYARVKYGMNNRGNYWLVDGNSRNGAVHEVVYYGIIPR
jgi:hypothetical protein|tara:strand:+ start:12439 stop:12969 length:531 start_codon:yes stop_codon:yes gene_type:complete